MPAAAATSASDSHEIATTWRAARSGEVPSRANGTVATSAAEAAVTATRKAAIRYAYENVVARPGPRPDENLYPIT